MQKSINNSDDVECFGCFRKSAGSLPNCTGSLGLFRGIKHDVCGDCIKHHARNTVINNKGLRREGIACLVDDCQGIFQIDSLEAHVEREVFEEIRRYVQTCCFEDALREGLPVEKCKKCTFFDYVDESHDEYKHFLCPQCHYHHCRLCGEEWDAEHAELNSCAESAKTARLKRETADARKRVQKSQKATKVVGDEKPEGEGKRARGEPLQPPASSADSNQATEVAVLRKEIDGLKNSMRIHADRMEWQESVILQLQEQLAEMSRSRREPTGPSTQAAFLTPDDQQIALRETMTEMETLRTTLKTKYENSKNGQGGVNPIPTTVAVLEVIDRMASAYTSLSDLISRFKGAAGQQP